MTKMAAAIQPIFTINDFPSEIIELFAPDLRPRTISTLRLVNRRFYQVFTSDRFYRSYLCYCDRLELYQKDLEEIGDVEDRWWRTLEKERERITVNWKNGRTTRVETIEFPKSAQVKHKPLKALIDKSGEYWMLQNCGNKKIVIVNFTNGPILSVHDISPYCNLLENYDLADLAPGQVVLYVGSVSHVFNYFKREESVALEYHFKIEGMGRNRNILSGKSNLLVTYNANEPDGLLRVWDIKTAVELNSISMKDFQPFEKCFEGSTCKWHATAGPFPNILVQSRIDRGPWAMGIINVEKGQMTNFFGWINNLESTVFFNDSYAGLETYEDSHKHRHFQLYALRSTYDSTKQQPVVFFMCKPGKTLKARLIGNTILIYESTSHYILDMMKRGSMMNGGIRTPISGCCLFDGVPPYMYRTEVYAMNISYSSELIPHKIKIPSSIESAAAMIVGPFVILTTKFTRLSKTFDRSGNELIDWEWKLKENGFTTGTYINQLFCHDLDHIQNLFKCILETGDGKLVIFNF